MFRFEKLEVWTESVHYGKNIYKITEDFPKREVFGLTSQLKRAAISVSSNIAEGSGSSSVKDFSNFLEIAVKSIFETVSQLLLTKELGYINKATLNELYSEAELLAKRTQGLRKSIQSKKL